MVAVNIDLSQFSATLKASLQKLADPEYLLRPVCLDLIDLMTKRIHQDGNDSTDSPIGTYNKQYLRLRELHYQRSSDPTIIVSLTRQLENDWSVIPTDNGYGVGFKNPLNYQKARWVEVRKLKEIFSLSPSEEAYVEKKLSTLISQAFQ